MHIGNSSSENFFFIISAPSGAGKTTVCNFLKERFCDELKLSISCTTRQPRNGEIDGLHYFFKTEAEFLEMKNKNMFIETAKVFDKYYGTPVEFVNNNLNENNNILFEVDWQGKESIENFKEYNSVSVFITTSSFQVLQERLIKRGDNLESIRRRSEFFQETIEKANSYDYVIINENLEKTLREVENIYRTSCVYSKKNNRLNRIQTTI